MTYASACDPPAHGSPPCPASPPRLSTARPITTSASASGSTAGPRSSRPFTSAPRRESWRRSRGHPPRRQHESVDIAAFGDVLALYDLAEQIGLVELIDRHTPPSANRGLSTGQYLLLAAINRAVHPTSKAQLADWYRQTSLPRLVPATARTTLQPSLLEPHGLVGEEHIAAIERELSRALVEQFGLSLRMLTYDGTNFFTYINTDNAARLPQRGTQQAETQRPAAGQPGDAGEHRFPRPAVPQGVRGQRPRRHDLPDASPRNSASGTWNWPRAASISRWCSTRETILRRRFETLDDSPFHFVGSLVPTQHRDLLGVPLRKFQPLAGERLKDCLA